MSIYELMRTDWKAYCLMSAIAYIEEMSKPTSHLQVKKYKNYVYECTCFHTVRLKMKDKEFIHYLFNITKEWEKRKNLKFIGKTYKFPRQDERSKQYEFNFNPGWLNSIISECGTLPNKYSYTNAITRINNLKHYKVAPIDNKKFLFGELFKDKKLAAGAFVVSMDLEFRGIQNGRPALCMSEPFKDFLEFMLQVANHYGWSTSKTLFPVDVSYSRNLGIDASSQYEFRINIKGLQEIYSLAGPLVINSKDKCINLHTNRSKKYVNKGGLHRFNNTKTKILEEIKKNKNLTTTQLQFVVNVGTDVILDHLHKLEKEGMVKKERSGKRYTWNLNN